MAVEAWRQALQRRFRLAFRKRRRLPAFLLLGAGGLLLLAFALPLLGGQGGPVAASTVEAPDADGDLVPDVFENALLGSDPLARAPAGALPEAWIARYGLDVADAELATRIAPYPRPPESPAAYGVGGLPPEHRMTYAEVYAYGRPETWDETRDGPWDSRLDPRRWDVEGAGVPYAWLVHHGLDPFTVALDERPDVPGVSWTPREAYERGLSPVSPDGDEDGLEDVAELTLGTDPRKRSTAGTGIADGWLVRNRLDPRNAAVADQDPDSDGLTNREEFEASMALRATATLAGGGLDPRAQSTVGGPLPDGWLVRVKLDPFDPDVATRVTETRLDANGSVDAHLTAHDEYRVNRPPGWNETRNGPWMGGTDPTKDDTDEDGLHDITEILGWEVVIGDDRRRVVSDPTRRDSDDDGLTDAEEERGRRGDLVFGRTNPSLADTDADGLRDGEEVGVVPVAGRPLPVLDPTHPDTDRDGLLDGEEAEMWTTRHATYAESPSAPYEWGPSPARRAGDVFAKEGLAPGAAIERILPGGDVDDDGMPNLLDPDSDGDGLADGWEARPTLYRETPHASEHARSRTDPANPDTDLDTLPDGWEVRYGIFEAVLGGWNLDPAAWSSRGDGTSDADADLDDDGTTWYAYHQTSVGAVGTAHEFVATNRVEYEANSDPNRASSSPDGLPDGWKIFWGSTYLGLPPDERGDVYPGAPGDLRLPPDRPLPRIGADDSASFGTFRYTRIQPTTSTALLAWERVERVEAGFVDMNDRPAPYRLVTGVVDVSYKGASGNATNPYLTDTDADGAPDAWESTWSRLGAGRLRVSPVVVDGEADPDADGLRNVEEALAGTNPYAADSDLGGAPDGVERAVGTSLLDPSDDRQTVDRSTDSDADGVPDTVELIGRAVGRGGLVRVTDPRDPDTDRDGLLDGESLSVVLGRKPRQVDDADLLAGLRDRGLLVRNFTDGTADVMGEETLASDPVLLSTAGDGVPDGWLALHNLPPGHASGLADAYAYGRPGWWNETQHGVWMWGLRPGATATLDHDKDGLDDRNGEDPIPYASRRNALPEGDPEAPDLAPAERLRRARHYGDLPPATAGVPERARANVTLDPLPEPLAANGTLRYTGNVTVENTLEPVANVTVVLSLGRRGLDLGATVTNGTGAFNGTILLAPRVPADPATAGVPAFGRVDGTGVHENAIDVLRTVDPNAPVPLFAWTYNVSPFAGGRQVAKYPLPTGIRVPGLLANESHVQLRSLHLPTSIAVTNATLHGQSVLLNATLSDGLARPIPDALLLVQPDLNFAFTDGDGRISLDVPLPPGLGPREIVVSFGGTPSLLPSNVTHRVFVRASPDVHLVSAQLSTRTNGTFAVAGALRLPDGSPVENVTVDAALGDLRASNVTDAEGRFRLVLRVPLSAPLGNATGLVSFRGSDTLDAARAPFSVLVVGRPAWTATDVTAPLDALPQVVGTLRDARGAPLAGLPVSLHHGARLVAAGFTDARGVATLPARIADAGPGTHTLLLRMTDPIEGAADRPVLVTLVSDTRVDAQAGEALRGRAVVLSGRLTDVLAQPLPARAIDVQLLGHAARAVTGADGRWRAEVALGSGDPLGTATAVVAHAGSPDGVFRPATARVPLLVKDGADLRLASTTLQLSAPALDGILLTLTGEPLVAREVRLAGAGGEALAVTDRDGRFHLVPPLAPRQPLGPADFRLTVPPERHLAPLEQTLVLQVRDAGRLLVRAPTFVIERGVLALDATLVDSRGLPAADATVRVLLDGVPLGEPRAPGTLRIPLPEGVTAGLRQLRVEAEAPLVAAPAVESPLEVRRATRLTLEAADPVRPAADGLVRVRLATGGAPLAEQALDVRSGGRVLRVATDAEGYAVVPLSSLPRAVTSIELAYAGTSTEGPAALTVALRPGDAPYAPEGASAWWIAAAVALALVAGAVYALARSRGAAATAIAQQARLLRSDRADVRQLYESYLVFLRLAGLDEAGAESLTFRDIAARVVVVGAETADAIETLAEAYSRAVYAPALLDAATLAGAAGALERLAEHTREDERETPPRRGEVTA